LHEIGLLDRAEEDYRALLFSDPRCSEAIHLLGLISHQRGEHAKALPQIERAIAIDRTVALYHFNRGNVLLALGRTAEACSAFAEAFRLKPDYPAARYNQAKTLAQLHRYAEAVDAFRALPAGLPGRNHDYANALLGEAGLRTGNEAVLLAEAIRLLEQNWQSSPDPFEARVALAWALQELRRWSEAAGHYAEALALDQGAHSLQPESAKAHNNLANCYNQLGRMDEAIAHYRTLYQIAPDYPDALTSVLANLNYDAKATPQQVFDEHLAWGQSVAAPLYPQAVDFANTPDPQRPLRVGFISPDLRRHPVSYIFAPILAAFDRQQIEAVCYYNYPGKDQVTARLMPLAAQWHDVAALSDEALYDLIRTDGIDILVDLAGHTIHNRLLVFARRAAPLQVSWLGYFNTTGLATMDYFISDYASSPPSQENYYSEILLRFPDSRFCYQPSEFMPPVNELPAGSRGHITFGCFNNLSKLNERVLRLWARVLAAVPDSRLLLQASALDDAPNRERFTQIAERAGLPRNRLELRGFMPVETAPQAYHDIDIALDPFPFCGGMTSLESLWMGVPVVTLEQEMIAGRQTLSLLASLDLPELVATDEDSYVAIAATLARDTARLAALRHSLRPRFAASPLQDYARFARTMEEAFRAMWQDWVETNGHGPESKQEGAD